MSKGNYIKCDYPKCRSLADAVCALCNSDFCNHHTVALAVQGLGDEQTEIDEDGVPSGTIMQRHFMRSSFRVCSGCTTQWQQEILEPPDDVTEDLFKPLIESMKAIVVEAALSAGRHPGEPDEPDEVALPPAEADLVDKLDGAAKELEANDEAARAEKVRADLYRKKYGTPEESE